ncbi:hypothetical protein [Caldanaerobacter subterraneus]|uniref:Uncharacterized protein n=1 Tax=Caldanaerobacter subterraneus TaxID=911092 RepID=A0A7Y2L713_9THEO|nr:hypothetical protein [Caldanaerobacter subterraneus]NNG66412.1 hypothetical protein [Caldanaerobacter subterraneus]
MLNFYGKALSLSPITHGAVDVNLDDKTNKGEIRRLPFVIMTENDSYTIFVPVVSGNGVKGLTRREFAQKIRRVLGEENFDKLPNEVKYFIAAGGANTNASPKIVKQEVYSEIRKVLPFISLLGGVYKGHYFRGTMITDFMVPLIKEIIPLYAHKMVKVQLDPSPDKYPDLSSLYSNEYIGYTRFKVEGIDVEDITDSEEDKEEKLMVQNQMIYYVKQIPAGTLMIHGFHLNKTSDIELSCFYAFLKTFIEVGHVGGNISKGHGQIKVEYYTENGEQLDIDRLSKLEEPFWKYLQDNKDKILEELNNLDSKLQWEVKDKNTKKKNKNENTEEK